ncbi:hypothetical protein MYP_4309 [Sporocytophaga myxococcoides]|uniref:eCIS core domain-containing protein n=1 Tax=Sporocytophaga myxococcoides TaxID=153721 RepID=A0A098LKQ7_9BACT|nr:DUF4157 domain-containing protein [Sporocytophaga myxococcoides]GAL87079.1 hypothetical protein MYP_4309 [Sporocytophaga myxococcoides]
MREFLHKNRQGNDSNRNLHQSQQKQLKAVDQKSSQNPESEEEQSKDLSFQDVLQRKWDSSEGGEEHNQRRGPVPSMMEEEEEEPLQRKGPVPLQFHAEEEEELPMQRKGPVPPISDDSGKLSQSDSSSSDKMPPLVQRKMETSFSEDFSNVNIHKNSAQSTDMDAHAFTQGNDIHFAPGQYNPESQQGQELLGHELTHVVQQRSGVVKPTTQMKGVGVNDDATLENEADVMGKKAAEGKPAEVEGAGSGIQKETAEGNLSEWRKNGKLKGKVPVRDENSVPDANVSEEESTYQALLAEAEKLQTQQRDRADKMIVNREVTSFNYWFAKVYSLVSKHEIEYVKAGAYYYPSYVLRCVLYFERLYNDNLNAQASGGKVEDHWKVAFDKAKDSKAKFDMFDQDQKTPSVGPVGEPGERAARAGQFMSNEANKAMAVVASLVASMLAHIRFDLPRAEAWVYNTYYKSQTPTIKTFMTDFMTMGGVFDNAGREMQAVIAQKGSGLAGITPKMAQDMSMRYLYGADMTKERADTWKRAEELSLLPQSDQAADPYEKGIGDVGKDPASYTDWLNKISTNPSMKDTETPPVKNSSEILSKTEQELAALPLVERIRMVAQMLFATTMDGAEDAIMKILFATQKFKTSETITLIDGVDPYELLHDCDGAQFMTLRFFLKSYYYSNAPMVSMVRLQNTLISVIKTFNESWEGDIMLDMLEKRPDRKSIVTAAGVFQPGPNTGPDKTFWDGFDILYNNIMKTEFQRSQLCALFGIPYLNSGGKGVPRPVTNDPNKQSEKGGKETQGHAGNAEKTSDSGGKGQQTEEQQKYLNIDIKKQDYQEIKNPTGAVSIGIVEARILERKPDGVKIKVKFNMNDGKFILVGKNEIELKGHYNAAGDIIETEAFTIPVNYDGKQMIISFKKLHVPVKDVKN